MLNITQIIESLLPVGPMDTLAVGVIDFNRNQFESLEASNKEGIIQFSSQPVYYFDLASLTKPLTNSLIYFLNPQLFDEKMVLCLNHRGGIPSWGLLSKSNWENQILSYTIHEAETLYSDFSSLRVMLELKNRIQGLDLKLECSQVWDKETIYWTDLKPSHQTLQNGFRNGDPVIGVVHDPNAWTIGTFCTHAGLFSTISGICQTLLNYQEKTGFIDKINHNLSDYSHRFIAGWDRVLNPKETLAGLGCSARTFGHLGFTGTSIWIDPDKMIGHVILSNATKYHWFNKSNLNDIRRAIGELVWQGNL